MADPYTRGPATEYDRRVGDTRSPITDLVRQDDTLQRFFSSLAPGAQPFNPNLVRPEAAVEPSIGAMDQKVYYAAGRQRYDTQPGVPPRADALDMALAQSAFPEVFQQEPEFAMGQRERLKEPLGFWESVKVGFDTGTLPGIYLSHQRLKSEVMALPGELNPVPGFDPLRDPVSRQMIADAGLESELWSFRSAASPNEVRFRIMQYQAREEDGRLMERASGAGLLLGTFADPTTVLPIVGAQSAVVKGFWGTLWRGGRAAAINAGYALAQEGLMADYDASYRNQGILDALEIPAALGFAVGVIHARTARYPETFNPRKPRPEPASERPPGDLPGGGSKAAPLGMDATPTFTADDILRDAPPHPTEAGFNRSLSSAAPLNAQSNIGQLLEQEALKETGTGLENLPMNPSLRLLQSMSLRAREIVTQLVDLGGLKQKKNVGPFAEPTSIPIEAEVGRLWKVKAIEALNEVQASWVAARGAAGAVPGDMTGTAWTGMKMQVRDWATRETGLTWQAFDERVAKAMRRGDKDSVRDGYSAHVERAAAATRRFHDDLKNAGMDPNVDIFGKANRKTIEKLQAEVAALKAKGMDSTTAEARLGNAISYMGRTGTQATALSYFTRYWNVSALTQGKDRFLKKVEDYFVRSGVQTPEARKSALEVYATLTRSEMRTITEEAEDFLRSAGDPMSAKVRSLEIPDIEIEEFLESSATLSIRHQLATLAPAIEMTRKFGDANLTRAIETIQEDYKKLHDAAKAVGDAPLMQKLDRQMKQDVEDVQTLRDRLLNVAGASKDPHSWDQRTIRLLKHYMTWTTMGLSAFSQLGDLLRPAITEGLDAMHRYGFATLISDSRNTIFKMAERERYLAGDSLEVVLASKAMAAADIGDVFASRSNWERKAGQFTNAFYMLNGMNHAVDLTKTWASVIVQSNINDAIYKWGMHILDPKLNAAPDALMMERLKSLSIDGNDALRMAQELAGKGINFKSVHLANTENWADTGARDIYRQALQRALQRTVVTPGLGDKPTWMSTPLGSLIGQFKSFGVSSTIRTLYAGLQDKDRNFFQGAAVLVGGGIVLNEIRAQLFSDKSNWDQPYLGILMDGVDRSGVIGSFTDVNNAIEAASNNKMGARPLMGAGKTYPVTGDRLASAFLGPSAGKGVLAADTLGRIIEGDFTARTGRQARQFVPLQNHFGVKAPESLLSSNP